MSFLTSALIGTAKVIKWGIDVSAKEETPEEKRDKEIIKSGVGGTLGVVALFASLLEEAGKDMFK